MRVHSQGRPGPPGRLTVETAARSAAPSCGRQQGDEGCKFALPALPPVLPVRGGGHRLQFGDELGRALRAFLRGLGVDVKDPDPGQPLRVTGSGGSGRNTLEEAAKKCPTFMQDAAPADADANDSKAHDQMVRFAQCMRENGVDIPDPKPGEGLKMQVPQGSRAKAEEAQKNCQRYLPGSMQMGPS